MLTYFKRLMWDESAFVGLARGMLLSLVAVMTMNGGELVIPQTRGQWSCVLLAAFAGYLRSSSAPLASPASAPTDRRDEVDRAEPPSHSLR